MRSDPSLARRRRARATWIAVASLVVLTSCSELYDDDELFEPEIDGEFSADPINGASPLIVQFSDLSTGDVRRWSWSFGDGEISTFPSPAHTYANPGTYTVRLRVESCSLFGDCVDDTEIKTDLITVTALSAASSASSPEGRPSGSGLPAVSAAEPDPPAPGERPIGSIPFGGTALVPPPDCAHLELLATCTSERSPHPCSIEALEAWALDPWRIASTSRTPPCAGSDARAAGRCTASVRCVFVRSADAWPVSALTLGLAFRMATEGRLGAEDPARCVLQWIAEPAPGSSGLASGIGLRTRTPAPSHGPLLVRRKRL